MPYTIEEHSHRSAAWDAATSARASKLCRFKVRQGVAILEACGFDAGFCRPNQLPLPARLTTIHRQWRTDVIAAARKEKLVFTHGVAAKLLNSYLKVKFVCGGHHDHERVKCLHPPIDELMLKELAIRDVGGFARQWRMFREARWSKFDSATYESVIALIQKSLPPGEPLWRIEEHWGGYA